MNTEEFELNLLEDYYDAVWQTDDPEEMAQQVALYEKQLLNCKNQGFEWNWPYLESRAYHLKAVQRAYGQSFLEDAFGNTDGLDFLATSGQTARVRKIVSLLTEAIHLYETPQYLPLRARMASILDNYRSALADVEYVLATFNDDEEVYLEARKLKDEIETSMSKGCFIATAVYEPAETAKVDLLRSYRDQVLLSSIVGRKFVSFYYAVSPSIARLISKSRMLKSLIRSLLLEPILIVQHSMSK